MPGEIEMTPEMLVKMLNTQEEIMKSIGRIEERLNNIDRELSEGRDKFKEIYTHFDKCPVNEPSFRYMSDFMIRHTGDLQEMIKDHIDKQKRKDTIKSDITKNLVDLGFKVAIGVFLAYTAASKIFHF